MSTSPSAPAAPVTCASLDAVLQRTLHPCNDSSEAKHLAAFLMDVVDNVRFDLQSNYAADTEPEVLQQQVLGVCDELLEQVLLLRDALRAPFGLPPLKAVHERLMASANERGNTLLANDDNMVFWRELTKGQYEEVSYTPGNDPAFHRTVVTLSEEDLAAHIHEHCDGWFIRRLHIAGVHHEGSVIVAPEDSAR